MLPHHISPLSGVLHVVIDLAIGGWNCLAVPEIDAGEQMVVMMRGVARCCCCRCSDPMSGFFCTSEEVYARGKDKVNAVGFKISLELMVRCQANPVQDVPITFRERVAGESKLTMKQNIEYIKQLMVLYWAMYPMLVVIVFLGLVGGLYFVATAVF